MLASSLASPSVSLSCMSARSWRQSTALITVPIPFAPRPNCFLVPFRAPSSSRCSKQHNLYADTSEEIESACHHSEQRHRRGAQRRGEDYYARAQLLRLGRTDVILCTDFQHPGAQITAPHSARSYLMSGRTRLSAGFAWDA